MESRSMSGRSILPGELQQAIVAELRRRTSRRGTYKRVAFDIGVSPNTLLNVLAGRHRPGLRFALGLGLMRLAPGGAAEDAPRDEEWRKDQLSLELPG